MRNYVIVAYFLINKDWNTNLYRIIKKSSKKNLTTFVKCDILS